MPASSAITASFLLSGQLPDQRSGTSVTARPDEQLEPNRPICSLLLLYIDLRESKEASRVEVCGACTVSPRLTDAISFISRQRGRQGAEFSWLVQHRPHACDHVRRRVGE